MSQPETQPRHAGLARRLADTRAFSETLCEPLTAEDMGLQACPEVSPPRWHLAHTTWFFETFILKPFAPGYKPSDCLLYTSPSPRDRTRSRMPSSA